MIQNTGLDKINHLKSTDGWKTARVVNSKKSLEAFPTTGVKVGNKFYVLNAKLSELFGNAATARAEVFQLQEVKF